MGPHGSLLDSTVRCPARPASRSRRRASGAAVLGRRTSRGVSAGTGSPTAINRPLKVTPLLAGGALRGGRRRPRRGTEERSPRRGPPFLTARSTGVDCSQCSPTACRAVEGTSRVAQGLRPFCRNPIRPVLKHGPRSLTCVRVMGWQTQRRNESEGRLRVGSGGISSAPGERTTGPSRSLWDEAEREHTRWDPKDGELCLSRTKPEETLVEVRSDSDVQIDRQTWV